jgi:hypothetical protein
VRSAGAVPSTIAAARRKEGKRDEQADVPFSLDLTLGNLGERANAAEPDYFFRYARHARNEFDRNQQQ